MKYEKFFVYKNVMMFIFKKNNALNFKSFYLKMMIKDKKHADDFDYACHLMKTSADVNWHHQTKNQSFVIKLNINYDMISVDVWFEILMLVMKMINEKKKNIRINAE